MKGSTIAAAAAAVATRLLRWAVFTLFPGHAIVVSYLQCVVGMVCSCKVGYLDFICCLGLRHVAGTGAGWRQDVYQLVLLLFGCWWWW